MYIGVDEAGRGALAGPLVVAGVYVSPEQESLFVKSGLPIRDSKVLSEIQRERVFQYMCEHNIYYVTHSISIEEINMKGIAWANYEGIKQVVFSAVQNESFGKVGPFPKVRPLKGECSVIVDGRFPIHKIAVPGIDITCVVDADATIFPVILAGIVAKVTRDRIMKQLHLEYSQFGWDTNKGYGTAFHIQSLREFSQSPHHRVQFVQTALKRTAKGLDNNQLI